jgi:ABC-2 type transport system permease protein
MRKIFTILKREYLVRVTSVPFRIISILGPFLFSSILIGAMMSQKQTRSERKPVAEVAAEGGERADQAQLQYEKADRNVSLGVGITSAVVIYFFIFFYGVRTLHAVSEEKTSRISEILISSVKPFQLLLGKIFGTAGAVFTQVIFLISLTLVISFSAVGFLSPEPASGQAPASNVAHAATFVNDNLPQIIVAFVLYFIWGFLFYSAIFAAIGAAIDDVSDSLQFIFPVLVPLVIGLAIALSAFSDPHSKTMFWASMIPLTSPVVMMVRVSFGVPWIQLVVSLSLLIITFFVTTVVAGKIYRIGILMHGSRPSYKTLFKWMLEKD